jgi:2-methylcitrate dehydratase PrpD
VEGGARRTEVTTRTARLSRYIAGAAHAELDEATRRLAARHLLDTLAAIVACRDLEPAVVARRYVARRTGSGEPAGSAGFTGSPPSGVTILGTTERAPVVDAVFAGAMTAHAAEINDFLPSVFVQPGPAIVAAAIGVGELTGASGAAVLGALVAGDEVAARVPRALGPNNLRRAGLASHGIGPCFGVATVASALLGLPATSIPDVLSLTAQQAAGSWQWLLDVDHIEKAFVFAGLGARNGLEAALLVDAGYRGVPGVLDRPGTWFTADPFGDGRGDGDLDALVDGLDEPYALAMTAYKRHPVGGPTQPAVDGMLDLVGNGVVASDVQQVLIQMPGRWETFRDAAMPALNLRYLAAVIILDGRLDFVAAQSLDRMANDPEVRSLMERVEVRHDPAQESGPGAERTESARVTVSLHDGERLERFVPHVLGFPSHPMGAEDVEAKALDLVVPHLGAPRAKALVAACRDPEAHSAADFAALVAR